MQPAAAVDGEELVKVDTHFQRRRPVEDEPEPVEDPARVSELGEELQHDLAVAGGKGDVEICGLGHVPVGRKFHSNCCVKERCGRCANARRSEEARGNYSRILYPGTVS